MAASPETLDVCRAVIPVHREIVIVEEMNGELNLPGGTQKDGETSEDALIRELQEEMNAVIRVRKLLHEKPAENGVTMHLFLAEIIRGSLRPQPGEIKAIHYMHRDEILGTERGRLRDEATTRAGIEAYEADQRAIRRGHNGRPWSTSRRPSPAKTT